MIVRITFLDRESKPFTVLFGNSYKHWTEQVQEFLNYEIVWQDRAELRFYGAFEKKVKMMYNKRLRHLKRKSFKTILASEMKIG